MCWSQTSRSWSTVTTPGLNLWWCFLSRLTDGNEYLFQAKDDVSVFFLFCYCTLCAAVHGEKQLLRAAVHSVCGWCTGPRLLRYSLWEVSLEGHSQRGWAGAGFPCISTRVHGLVWESEGCAGCNSSVPLGLLKEEMNTWIQAITSAISSDKIEVSPTTQSTPASSRAQTLPASVTITSESSPGKREKDKEKDKEKRFSLFGKKKWIPSPHTALLWPFQWNSSMRAQNQYVTLCASCSSMWLTFFYL